MRCYTLMKKKDVLNLIKYHYEGREKNFRNQSIKIAKDFEKSNDIQLSQYIIGIMSENDWLVPQNANGSRNINENKIEYAHIIKQDKKRPFPLPDSIFEDLKGVANAIKKGINVNKFLFTGLPGTGKTESVKYIAKLLDRKVLALDTSNLVDSALGKTSKNIKKTFNEINSILNPEDYIFLIDELDSIALDRINNQDLREMGRVTSTFLKCLDSLNPDISLIATTNLNSKMDVALLRRFDAIIDFNRYSSSDLVEVAKALLDYYAKQYKFNISGENTFIKLLKNASELPYPGELENIIKASLAFSDPNDENEYLALFMKKLYLKVPDIRKLHVMGFSVREIETLTGQSKSNISRKLNMGETKNE